MELISIIVPIYNVEKYLEDCLISIINQTYINLEIILIDDGSTDNCGKICDEYSQKDKRIIVKHKKNGGVSSARNAGLEIAKGKYIGFVDPDDWITADMYEVLYNNIKKYNANISVCRHKIQTGRDVNNKIENKDSEDIIFLNSQQSMRYMLSYQDGYACGPCNKLYRREILKKFNDKYSIGEDLLVNFEIYYNKNNVTVFDNNVKYFYYLREDSACNLDKLKRSNLMILKIWDKILIDLLKSEDFKRLYPIAMYSFSKVIWSILIKLTCQNKKINKKIFYLIKWKYRYILKNFKAKNIKDYILKILYYFPYFLTVYLSKAYRNIKFNL